MYHWNSNPWPRNHEPSPAFTLMLMCDELFLVFVPDLEILNKLHFFFKNQPMCKMVLSVFLLSFERLDALFASFGLEKNVEYCQTWANDNLRITTTCCLQRPIFLGPFFNFYNTELLLNNDHLSTTATNLGYRGWSLYTGLTVLENFGYFLTLWQYLF